MLATPDGRYFRIVVYDDVYRVNDPVVGFCVSPFFAGSSWRPTFLCHGLVSKPMHSTHLKYTDSPDSACTIAIALTKDTLIYIGSHASWWGVVLLPLPRLPLVLLLLYIYGLMLLPLQSKLLFNICNMLTDDYSCISGLRTQRLLFLWETKSVLAVSEVSAAIAERSITESISRAIFSTEFLGSTQPRNWTSLNSHKGNRFKLRSGGRYAVWAWMGFDSLLEMGVSANHPPDNLPNNVFQPLSESR